jgi:RHS repeat-associated protein
MFAGQSARLKVSRTDLGDMASLTYPQISGVGPSRTICSSYANGFLVGISDVGAGSCPGGTSLASLSYHANGMVNVVSHGNGVLDTSEKDPNDMGRPYRIVSSNALANWNSGIFEYDGAGNIKALRGMVEPVARPAGAHQDYTYDGFGNLTKITLNDTTYQDLPTSASSNRLTASGYDPSGNITAWGGYGYGYDALNAMTTLTGGTLNKAYGYDADGERLSFKDVPSNTTTYSLRGLDGKVLREYSYNGSTWSWSKDVVYRNGRLLAAIDTSGTKHFTLDHLGSPRLITNADRSAWAYHAYWAYGQELDTTSDTERMKFTGHERDLQGTTATTDDLDYMHARYYNPTIGRFLSVDPVTEVKKALRAPQMWNRYAYVVNNPLKFLDPAGKLIELTTEFKKRFENDPAFKRAFELWRKTQEGEQQWQRLAADKDTLYTFKVGSPPADAAAWGQALPSPQPYMERGAGGQLNQPNVQLVFNPAAIESSLSRASDQTIVRNIARNLAHEAAHAMDMGLGIKTYLGVMGVDEAIKQRTEPRLNRFNLQLDALLPPLSREPY